MISIVRRVKTRLHLDNLRYKLAVLKKLGGSDPRECPNCGYIGPFGPIGQPPRYGAECPKCGSLERHRLFYLGVKRLDLLSGVENILHFAPEPSLTRVLEHSGTSYRTADLEPGRAAMVLNIEKIDLPDKSVDLVVASHILEHVDDKKALRELRRILTDQGRLIVMIPIIEGWTETYEDPTITSEHDRQLHFGQSDHVRFFGRDFRDRVSSAGFSNQEFAANGADTVKYGLLRGERLFVLTKA
jgi:SAM-dependent methyltransferase